MLGELTARQYFGAFEFRPAANHWACFLCSHPEKVADLLQQDGLPLLRGQLKEKKGRLKLLKPWKTRFFTLSGATITYSKKNSVSQVNVES